MAKRPVLLALFSAMLFLGVAAHGEGPAPEPQQEIKAACTRMLNVSVRDVETRTAELLPLSLDPEKAQAIAKMSQLPGFNVDSCIAQVEIALGLAATKNPSR